MGSLEPHRYRRDLHKKEPEIPMICGELQNFSILRTGLCWRRTMVGRATEPRPTPVGRDAKGRPTASRLPSDGQGRPSDRSRTRPGRVCRRIGRAGPVLVPVPAGIGRPPHRTAAWRLGVGSDGHARRVGRPPCRPNRPPSDTEAVRLRHAVRL